MAEESGNLVHTGPGTPEAQHPALYPLKNTGSEV